MAIGTGAAILGGAALGGGLGLLGSSKAASAQKQAANQSAGIQRYMFDQSQAMQAPWQQTGASALAQLAGLYGLNPINYMGQGPEASLTYAGSGQRGEQLYGGGVWDFNDGSGRYSSGPAPVREIPSAAQMLSSTPGQPVPASGGFASNVPTQEAALAAFQTSPGYQFRMDEGMKALGGMASAQGLRGAGATSEDIMRYSQGLASDEYNQYTNRLAALAGIGQTSAGNMGQQAMYAGQGIGNAYSQAGNARASGILGVANSLGNAVNNAAWMYGMYGGGANPQTYGVAPGGGIYTDSDARLKDDIEPIGPRRYRWKWNAKAHELGIDHMPTEGEMAQEVLLYEPERVRVGPHGYLQIRVA